MPDLHADTLSPLTILLIFAVVLAVVLRVLYVKHQRSAVETPGYGRHITFFSCLLAIVVVGCTLAAIFTERMLDRRDAVIGTTLSKHGIQLLAVDGNTNEVKVRSGACTAWFEIKDGTFWDGKGWPLTGVARDLVGDCTGGEFAPK